MQGKSEKYWVRERRAIREITTLLVSILFVHNHSMYHHLHSTHERKKSVLFFGNTAFMSCHPHISHILSCRWQHSTCSAFLLVSLSGWVCFGVLCVYVCMCANLCMCCSSSTALACHSNLLSQWVEAWFWYLNKQGCLWQCSSPAVPSSLTQYLKMLLL